MALIYRRQFYYRREVGDIYFVTAERNGSGETHRVLPNDARARDLRDISPTLTSVNNMTYFMWNKVVNRLNVMKNKKKF